MMLEIPPPKEEEEGDFKIAMSHFTRNLDSHCFVAW